MLALKQLQQHLLHYRPQHILLASRSPWPSLAEFASKTGCEITLVAPGDTNPFSSQAAFAIVIDYLEHIDKDMGLQRLAQWRNLISPRMWVAISEQDSRWQFNDFLGLGFRRLPSVGNPFHTNANQGDSVLSTYGYDVGEYNHRRDWNNPRFWANPDMWSKRW